jgi:hypothetical protein
MAVSATLWWPWQHDERGMRGREGRADSSDVKGSRAAWGLWAALTLAAVPASALLWFFGAQGLCGEEVYDTPPGSTGDALCQTLVEPVAPWLVLSALPLAIVLLGGFAGIRLGSSRLFLIALTAPFVVVLVAVFTLLALF